MMPSWSGLWDHIHGQAYAPTGSKTYIPRDIARALKTRGGRTLGKIIATLTGQAVGATATDTTKRIKQPDNPTGSLPFGGTRQIETVTTINRVTTAADELAVDAMTNDKWAPATYPVNKDGRAAGGMVGKL